MSADETKTCPVQVVVRARPVNEKEKQENVLNILSFPNPKEIMVTHKPRQISKGYSFDCVYGPDSTQSEVYQNTIAPIVNEMLKGFNCTIFAYGQTGTGKTHTMEGYRGSDLYVCHDGTGNKAQIHPDAGIIPRAAYQIFNHLENCCTEYTVRVSFLELYNEELIDLLGNSTEPLKIFEDNGRKGITVHNLEELPVTNSDDIFKVLENGFKKRQTAETNLNKTSSRSHCIFSIIVHTKESTPEGEDLLKVGKLNLVDLAGSENVGRSGAQNMRKREAGLINQSLLTLGRVITALAEHHPHVPYRESKLTRLLQDSLGGKTKTCIIATLSPSHTWLEETLSTLDYAHRAQNIKNKPEVNQKMTKRALIKEYVQEIERLKANLVAAREGTGFFIAQETFHEMESQIQSDAEKIQELETQVQGTQDALTKLQQLFVVKDTELLATTKVYEETKNTLNKVNSELSSTHAVLQQTKETLEDHKLALNEHEQNEKLIHDNAMSLYTTLTSTINDIDGLHTKIDRKKSTEEENKRKINEFCRYLIKRISSLEERVSQFEVDQKNNQQLFEETLQQFALSKQQELSVMKNTLNQFFDTVWSTQQQVVSLTEALKVKSTDQLTQLVSSQEGHSNQMEVKMAEYLAESTRVVKTFRETLQGQQEQIRSWSQHRREEATQQRQVTQQFTEGLKSELNTMQHAVESVVRGQVNSMDTQRSKLLSLVQQQQAEMETFKTQLVSQLQQALAKFSETHAAQLSAGVHTVNEMISSNISDMDTLLSSVRATADHVTEQSNVYHNAAVDNTKHLHQHHEQLIQESQSVHNNLSNQLDCMDAHWQTSCGALLTAQKIQTTTWNSAVVTEKSEINSTLDTSLSRMADVHAKQTQFQCDLSEKLDKATRSEENEMNVLREQMDQRQSATTAVRSSCSADVGQIKGDVTRFFSTLKEDKPTGNTPIKKKITLPTQIPKPIQSEVLIAEYQKKKSKTVDTKENKENFKELNVK